MSEATRAPEAAEPVIDDDEAPPPVGGSWERIYLVVILWLALQIALCYLFTRALTWA